MPKQYTAEQLAASAAVGELRTQKSFAGDSQAWHTYQETCYSTLYPGEALPPVGHESRPDLWKAAVRQRKKIEAKRTKDADDQPGKKLKTSARWQHKNVAGVSDVQLGSPRPSECGRHVLRQLGTASAEDGTTCSPARRTAATRW